MGLVAPPKSAGMVARVRGILLVVVLFIAVLALGFGIVYGIGQAAGGLSVDVSIFYGFLLVLVVLGGLAYWGRRKQKRLQAERADQIAARSR
jgi:peptidoglycan/LPS O-acetylase OafA/YrhL